MPVVMNPTSPMKYTLTGSREEDGRIVAEVPELPGVLCYGHSEGEALAKVEALALRVLAERLERGEAKACSFSLEIRWPERQSGDLPHDPTVPSQ